MRFTHATIDLGAIAHNVSVLAELAAPAQLCVVVKADGYGHGALPVARTAVSAGAGWLAVALVEEGMELRQGGIEEPILLLSEPRPQEMVEVIAHQLRPTVYSPAGVAAVTAGVAAADQPGTATLPVHLKVDTGMHRVGATPADALKLAQTLWDKPEVDLEGIWTHCATADEQLNPFADTQLERFEQFLATTAQHGISPKLTHAANSAVLLTRPHGHLDLVRVGVAVYGISPLKSSAPASAADSDVLVAGPTPEIISQLRPAMQLRSQISFVKQVPAGSAVSYGQMHRFDADTTVATVPIGYADGVRRDFGLKGGSVLIGGELCRVVGTVTMDQLMVEIPPGLVVEPGDEVVLIGRQAGQTGQAGQSGQAGQTEQQAEREITAGDVAGWLDTIPYEIICDVGKRVRREYI